MTSALERQGGTRSLSTARAVLCVLDSLLRHPEGLRADQVAQVVGKSVSTAYYLLTSLCDEGFAVHDSHAGLYRPAREAETVDVATPRGGGGRFGAAVEELFRRTHKRCYLAVVDSGVIEIVLVRGRQGMPKLPGLGSQIGQAAHALAIGKVVLAELDREAVDDYVRRGLRSFTSNTITRRTALAAELEAVRRNGYAVDRAEFALGFCCIAAQVVDERGQLTAVLALSATVHSFEAEQPELVKAVCEVASAAGRALDGRARPDGGGRLQAPAKPGIFLNLPSARRTVEPGSRKE
jgi:acetyl-CoA synthetase